MANNTNTNEQAKPSMATRLSERMDNDGTRWFTPRGVDFDELCMRLADYSVLEGKRKHVFADGSSIVMCDAAWDVGLQDSPDECFCWDGCKFDHYESAPHNPSCAVAYA